MLTMQEISAIPKVELHRHLEGSLDLALLWEYMQEHEPGRHASFEEFKTAATIEKGTVPGFKAFLAKFDALRFYYGSLENIEALAFKCAWSALEQSQYFELRFSPVFFARRLLRGDAAVGPDIPFGMAEEAAEAVVRGATSAAQSLGRTIEFIVTCSRHFGLGVNEPALDLLHRPIGKKIKGLDLAGDESVDASEFLPAFREWKAAGKMITIHAGEDPAAAGPGKIIEALDVFGADRIGHGVRAIEDPEFVARLARERIPLEICPTSNVQTRAVANEAAHPIKKLFDAGVCVTINTDDPTICGTTLEEEYAFAARLGLSAEELLRCSRNAVEASVLDVAGKGKLRLGRK